MLDDDSSSRSSNHNATGKTVSSSDLIELYKHHFDLFLKGYALQLAVLSGVAGFAFDGDSTRVQRISLLGFGAVVCVVCAFAWRFGMKWRKHFTLAFDAHSGDRQLSSAITHLSGSILPLALASSLIMSVACLAFVWYYSTKPESLVHPSSCACSLVQPIKK